MASNRPSFIPSVNNAFGNVWLCSNLSTFPRDNRTRGRVKSDADQPPQRYRQRRSDAALLSGQTSRDPNGALSDQTSILRDDAIRSRHNEISRPPRQCTARRCIRSAYRSAHSAASRRWPDPALLARNRPAPGTGGLVCAHPRPARRAGPAPGRARRGTRRGGRDPPRGGPDGDDAGRELTERRRSRPRRRPDAHARHGGASRPGCGTHGTGGCVARGPPPPTLSR